MFAQNKYGVDTLKILMKITYMWLALAIVAPGLYVAIAYFLSGGEGSFSANPNQELYFWMFLGISIAEGVIAFFLRRFLMGRPAIFAESTFARDFETAFLRNFLIVSGFMEAIAIYGLVQFLAFGADLQVVLLFAILSVIGFQAVRPREKFMAECLRVQEAHVAAGRFASRAGQK